MINNSEDLEFVADEVMVQSPFGLYIDGQLVEHTGGDLTTHYPKLVDPNTGYTIELAVSESTSIQLEDNVPLMDALMQLSEEQQRELIDTVIKNTVQYIREFGE